MCHFSIFIDNLPCWNAKNMLNCVVCAVSENVLVLDVFFEALNYETIEQRKAYEVAGLLGKSVICANLAAS